ncbi:MAG: GNAT family N-acetyltransferase [Firmicutes bacterium]|nr:GNAT family N-acetyltransferase [Bacillota bacterium]
MLIKQALLEDEIYKIILFLEENNLKYDEDIVETYYIEEFDKIIGSISRSKDIIKALAVDIDYRGENIANILVSEVMNSMRYNNVYHFQVYTKTEYEVVFTSMGFNTLAKTEKVCILESGNPSIEIEIQKMKLQIEKRFHIDVLEHSIGAIVVNCNPITLGHYHLIEEASKKHEYFIVLVVEEDQSIFSFKERFSLIYLALTSFENIIILPSTQYIVSALTFPSYFLKSLDEVEKEHAKLDAIIFKNYFMKSLNIRKRYIGSETTSVMVMYNSILKEILKDKINIQERFKFKKEIISASLVRKLIFENKINEAMTFVPEQIKSVFEKMAKEKYEQSVR